jgi:hypothetical protein
MIVFCSGNMVISESEIMGVLGCALEPSGPQDIPKLPLYPVGFCDCLVNSPEHLIDCLLITFHCVFFIFLLIISWDRLSYPVVLRSFH